MGEGVVMSNNYHSASLVLVLLDCAKHRPRYESTDRIS
jgi:hypothetical protein